MNLQLGQGLLFRTIHLDAQPLLARLNVNIDKCLHVFVLLAAMHTFMLF